ncbi:DUF6233 domain-containing protein [Streptomyces sp. NPDC050485]|uniref:DUF6233 domain-containing protein n=1 Tax=Streptomyces sp. NPDC050485 TaxID=3365617 RepID=UPI0037B4D37D
MRARRRHERSVKSSVGPRWGAVAPWGAHPYSHDGRPGRPPSALERMSELLPSGETRLLVLERYLELQLEAVRKRLADLARSAVATPHPEPKRRPSAPIPRRPMSPEWVVELNDGLPERVHEGQCRKVKARRSAATAVTAHEARVLLANGLSPCPECSPDIELDIDTT